MLGLKSHGQGDVVLIEPLVHVLELVLKAVALHEALDTFSLGIFDHHHLRTGQSGSELLQSVQDCVGDVSGSSVFDGENQVLQGCDSLAESLVTVPVRLQVPNHAPKSEAHVPDKVHKSQGVSCFHDELRRRRQC